MIGIYKITSPSNKIYIGQAVNIKKRWSDYQNPNNIKGQRRLYNSLIFHGVTNHKFEVIEECEREKLDEREIYWGNYHNVLGKNGLCCKLGNGKGIISEETRQRMSIANKGKKKGKKSPGSGCIKKGHIFDEVTLNKMSKAKLGKPSLRKGKKDSPESSIKKSLAMTGKPSPKKGKTYGSNKNKSNYDYTLGSPRNKEVIGINIIDNNIIIFRSAKEVKDKFNLTDWKCYDGIKNNKIINNIKLSYRGN